MFWIVLYIWVPLIVVAAAGEGLLQYIDYRREKYGRFINVNFRKQWM